MESGKTFFSYSRDDSEFVKKLAEDLRANGVDIWLDQDDIAVGKNWDDEIQRALVSAQNQLIVLTPSAVSSPNVMNEIMVAVTKKKNIIPIKLKECETPLQIARLQWIDFTTDYEKGFNQLLKTLDTEKTVGISEDRVSTPMEKQKPTREAEPKREERLRQETKAKFPLDKSTSAYDSGVKKSPMKLIAAVAAVVIVVVLAIIIIVSMGPDENTTSPTQESELVDTEFIENDPNEVNAETIQEEPSGEIEITSDYYEHDNGAFHRDGNKWIETGLESNNSTFTFEETGRDADYIYIKDASRGMSLKLPTVDGYCLQLGYNESGEPEWQQLYYLRIVK